MTGDTPMRNPFKKAKTDIWEAFPVTAKTDGRGYAPPTSLLLALPPQIMSSMDAVENACAAMRNCVPHLPARRHEY